MNTMLPEHGLPAEALFEQMREARAGDIDWRKGRLGVYIHFGGEDVLEVAKQAYLMFFSENALGPSAFPSLRKFENEVVAWISGLLGNLGVPSGNMTSGGTESIFLAMKSIRDWARANSKGGDRPQVLVPYSAHPAFSKSGHLLGMQVQRVPLGDDLRADVQRTEAAIGPNTVALVGSAPTFPHGVVDPIEALASLALKHELWLHVDACVGGYVLPFVRRLGYEVPAFDFSIDGVRSISADSHKYGFAAKGASTIVYADPTWHAYQIYEFDDWSYGRYSAPTLAGTRPGGAVAAAWAVMRYLGVEGYTRIVGEIMRTRDALADGIKQIDTLHINGEPEGPIMTFGSDSLDIYQVAAAMRERGWFALTGARPRTIHLGMLTAVHVPIVEHYLRDLKQAVDQVRSGQVTKPGQRVGYGS